MAIFKHFQAASDDLNRSRMNTDILDCVVRLREAANKRDGFKAILGADIIADGQWYTRVVDLAEAGCVAPVTQMAVQCFSAPEGAGRL